MRLNLRFLKIIYFLRARYRPKVGHSEKSVIKQLFLFLRLMKMKNGSLSYDINSPRPRHKYSNNIKSVSV